MKVTAKIDFKVDKKTYPYFGVFTAGSCVVLFTKSACGIVVSCASGRYLVGRMREDWDESSFEPFYGTITIAKD